MTREGKVVVSGVISGVIVGIVISVLFGILDIQCRGTGKPNWNAQLQVCE